MSRARRLASLMLALLILISTFTAPVAASSTATAEELRCTEVESWLWVFSGSLFSSLNEQCDPVRLSEDINTIQQASDNQTKIDLYTAAASQEAQMEVTYSFFDNYMQDTKANAWMKGEAALARAYENNLTQIEAQEKMADAIRDYYAVKQLNLIESVNTTTNTNDVIHGRIVNESGIEESYFGINGHLITDGGSAVSASISSQDFVGLQKGVDTTLVNGTTANVTAVRISVVTDDGSATQSTTAKVVPWGPNSAAMGWSSHGRYVLDRLYLEPPTTGYSEQETYNISAYKSRWNAIEAANSEVQSSVGTYVNATWQGYQDGEISPSDVLSRPTIMYEYGTDGAQFYDVLGALAQAGFDTPDLNSTGVMNVTYNDTTVTGMVFARNAPNGSWSVNTTYNASTIPGPVFLATVGGEKIDLSGEFVITRMESKSGDSIQQVTTTEYVYKTANVSDILALQQQLLELTKQIEDREQKATGGSGDGSGWSWDWLSNLNDPWLIGGAVVGSIALIGALGMMIRLSRPF